MKEEFNKKEMSEKIIMLLENSRGDFSYVKSAYLKACFELRNKFKYTDKIIEYNNCIAAYETELAFEQGIKDNLNYFNNPSISIILNNNYYDTDIENVIRQKTEGIIAERQKLVKLLPGSLIPIYDAVIEYTAFLDTYIPKLAHYYGFVYGNTLLKTKISDYSPDFNICKKYKDWLSSYLDIDLEGKNNALL